MERKRLDDLLVKIASGDNNAFAEFYQTTLKGVYVFAYSYLKEKTATEDLVQEAYIQIKLKAHTYKSGTNPKGWFLQIVKNMCIDEIRKRNRSESLFADGDQLEKVVASPFEENSAMRFLLDKLTDEEKEIVLLHIYWGYKHKEIAKMLNIPLGTALWRYNGAIKKLKAYKEDL